MAAAGVPPRTMGIGPVPAIDRLLTALGSRLDAFDTIEINEAFAAQVLACTRALGLADDERGSIANGGALALGHPLGASGARLALTRCSDCTTWRRRPCPDRDVRRRRPGGGHGVWRKTDDHGSDHDRRPRPGALRRALAALRRCGRARPRQPARLARPLATT
jgi:hypothetical protein